MCKSFSSIPRRRNADGCFCAPSSVDCGILFWLDYCSAITVPTKGTQVQKVTHLLQNLIADATKDEGVQARVFSKCTSKSNDVIAELGYERETLNTRILTQEAHLESSEADLRQTRQWLTDDLPARHVTSFQNVAVKGEVGHSPQTVVQRSEDKVVSDVNFKDLSEPIDVLQRAIDVVSSELFLHTMSIIEPFIHRVMAALLQDQ